MTTKWDTRPSFFVQAKPLLKCLFLLSLRPRGRTRSLEACNPLGWPLTIRQRPTQPWLAGLVPAQRQRVHVPRLRGHAATLVGRGHWLAYHVPPSHDPHPPPPTRGVRALPPHHPRTSALRGRSARCNGRSPPNSCPSLWWKRMSKPNCLQPRSGEVDGLWGAQRLGAGAGDVGAAFL